MASSLTRILLGALALALAVGGASGGPRPDGVMATVGQHLSGPVGLAVLALGLAAVAGVVLAQRRPAAAHVVTERHHA